MEQRSEHIEYISQKERNLYKISFADDESGDTTREIMMKNAPDELLRFALGWMKGELTEKDFEAEKRNIAKLPVMKMPGDIIEANEFKATIESVKLTKKENGSLAITYCCLLEDGGRTEVVE